jgi:hypothetical protein
MWNAKIPLIAVLPQNHEMATFGNKKYLLVNCELDILTLVGKWRHYSELFWRVAQNRQSTFVKFGVKK